MSLLSDDLVPAVPEPRSVVLSVGGMTCASCASRIERKLKTVPGVQDAVVNFASQKAYVRVEQGLTPEGDLEKAVEEAGYSAKRFDPGKPASRIYEAEQRSLGWRVALGGLFVMPFLMQHLLMAIRPAYDFLPPALQLAFAAPVYLAVGWPFHRAALRGLRHGETTMDTLVSLGSSAAFLASLAAMAGAGGELYFGASGLILFFVTLGRYFEVLSKRRANRALEMLMNLRPRTAHVMRDTGVVDLPVEMVGTGDILQLRAAESVPVDGVVVEGEGGVDESLLTGEAAPVDKHPGAKLYAGTVNGAAVLWMEASAVGDGTSLAQIMRLVEEAQGSKAPIQRTADRVASRFVPAVLVLSVATLMGWVLLAHRSFSTGLGHAIAVLVIACPCALGLAVPIVLMVGIGVGARRGILIRNAGVLEKSRNIDVILFDKTGTLTEGKPRLTEVRVMEGFDRDQVLRWAASVESGTNHPLAAAILAEARVLDLEFPQAEKTVEFPGAGIQGYVGEHRVAICGFDLLGSREGVALPPDMSATVEMGRQKGQTVSLMAVDGRLAALLVLEDPVRPEAAEVVKGLKRHGMKVHLLTGDNADAAERVARSLGMDAVKSEAGPEEKLDYLRALQAKGLKVAMVGDGYNDAAVLAAADLGIAMGSGTDVAKESGDMVLMRGGLSKVLEAFHLSEGSFAVIRQNLFWAFGYNLLALPLAVFAHVPPAVAALAMSLSSVSVVLNALRLYFKKF